MTTVLITGVTGFIGAAVAAALSDLGIRVLGVGRRSEQPAGVQSYYRGDIARSDVLDQVTEPVDAIVHAAADVYRCHGHECVVDNVYATIRLAQYASKWRTPKLIFTSTSGVYATPNPVTRVDEAGQVEPEGLYAITKYLAEQALQVSTVPTVTLRISYVYGDGAVMGWIPRLVDTIRSKGSVQVRKEARDYVHVRDVADAIIRVLTYAGASSVFNVGTGKSLPMITLAERLCSLLGVSPQVRVAGRRHNAELDCGLAATELGWRSSRMLLDDLPGLLGDMATELRSPDT